MARLEARPAATLTPTSAVRLTAMLPLLLLMLLQAGVAEGRSCSAFGSLHLLTFDGRAVDFPHSCKYTLAKTCSRLAPVGFDIKIKISDVQLQPALSIQYVEVTTEGKTVRLLPDGTILNDGVVVSSYEYKCKFKVQRVPLGIEMAILTANVTVTVTDSSLVVVRAPESLKTLLCGLCGNYDEDENNDFSDRSVFDWFIPDPTDSNCTAPPVAAYTTSDDQLYSQLNADSASCGWFNATSDNRFTSCARSQQYLMRSFYEFCVKDVKASCPDDEGSACYAAGSCDCRAASENEAACRLAEALATECAERGTPSPEWRGDYCPKTCPSGSDYTKSASSCAQSCSATGGSTCPLSLSCTQTIYTDGCICPEGKRWFGSRCVEASSCGCAYGSGMLYPVGAKWIDSTCSAEIECLPNGQLNVTFIECAEQSDCLIVDNVRKCVCRDGYEGDGRQECRLVCNPGQKVATTNDSCESCPVGTYQPSATTANSCIPCPSGSLTPTTGSVRSLDCNVIDIIPTNDKETIVVCTGVDCVTQVSIPSSVLPGGVAFYGTAQRSLWVSSNGIVSFDGRFVGNMPTNLLQVRSKVVAPYWFRQDLSGSGSSLKIGQYSQVSGREKLPLIEKFLEGLPASSKQSSALLWAMVATWTSAKPFPGHKYLSENATYQLIIASDGSSTRAAFVYPRNGLNLRDSKVLRNAHMGMSGGNGIAFSFYGSGTEVMSRLDKIDSNTGVPGKWIFVISKSDSTEATQSCVRWYALEAEIWKTSKPLSFSCPCDSIAATADRNFQMNSATLCAVSTFPFSLYNMYQMCCYEPGSSSPNARKRLITDPNRAGRPLKYNPIKNIREYTIFDEKPFLDCCVFSENCHLYRQYRPADDCLRYRPPASGGGGGDPHFVSLDGLEYTFNAIGEFHLIKSPIMRIQSRLGRFRNADATDFKAIACQALHPLSSRVHVEVNYNKSGLIIHVKGPASDDDRDETSSFSGTSEKVLFYDRVTVSGTTGKLKVTFQNGYAVDIELANGMIQQSISVPPSEKNSVSGLLGNFDGLSENDFMLPNQTVLDCRSGTLQCMHYDFGLSWRISKNESIFWYIDKHDTATYTDFSFVPRTFGNFADVPLNVKNDCAGIKQCEYDFAATGDLSVSLSTKAFIDMQTETQDTLATERPKIQTNLGSLNVIANVPLSILFDITSPSPKNTTLVALSQRRDFNLTKLNDSTYYFHWIPTGDISGLPLRFIAIDNKAGTGTPSAILTIKVALCDCNNGGTCLWPNSFDTNEFVMVACNCSDGWTGNNCSQDFDACLEAPCSDGGICTDLPPGQAEDFECECWPGYYLSPNEQTCLDVDECNNGTAVCGTNEQCVNTQGSYSCECIWGYARNTRNNSCEDIDECAIGGINDCQQICQNTNGGYNCSCFSGYQIRGSFECAKVNETEQGCQKLNCSTACVIDAAGTGSCTCPKGFYLLPTNGSCADINECDTWPCGANTTCINTVGSFECPCDIGFRHASANKIKCEGCPPGTFGADCLQTCNCGAKARLCDPVLGCRDCVAGWSGSQCAEDINECENATICDGFPCDNTPGSYICQCSSGYKQNDSLKKCDDIDECITLASPCKAGLNCSNTPGSYVCKDCLDGYAPKGDTCAEIDECLGDNNCSNASECVNTAGSYECRCPRGYFGDGLSTGTGCQDVNECSADPGPCPRDASCTNTIGSYECACKENTKPVYECCISSAVIDECYMNATQSGCSSASICCSDSGEYSCKCGNGISSDGVCVPAQSTGAVTTSRPELTTMNPITATSLEPELTSGFEQSTAQPTRATSSQPGQTTVESSNLTSPKWELTTEPSTNATPPKSDPSTTSGAEAIPPGDAVSEYLPLWITAGVLGGILVLAAITVLTVSLVRRHRRTINLHRQNPTHRQIHGDRSSFADYLDGIFRPSGRRDMSRRSRSNSTSTASSGSTDSYHSSPEGRVGRSVPFGPRWPKAYGRNTERPVSYLNSGIDEDEE